MFSNKKRHAKKEHRSELTDLDKIYQTGFQWQGSRWLSRNPSKRDLEAGYSQSSFSYFIWEMGEFTYKNMRKVASLLIQVKKWGFSPICCFPLLIDGSWIHHRYSRHRKLLFGKFQRNLSSDLCSLKLQGKNMNSIPDSTSILSISRASPPEVVSGFAPEVWGTFWRFLVLTEARNLDSWEPEERTLFLAWKR